MIEHRAIPYLLALLLAAVLVGVVGLLTWRRRGAPGAAAFAVICLGVTVWSLGYAAELASLDLGSAVFWAKLEYLSIGTLPLAWLIFALQYTGQEHRIPPTVWRLLAIPSLLVVLLAWTNEGHGLIWATVATANANDLVTLNLTHGPAFWAFAIYSYALLALGTFLLLRQLPNLQRLYRIQALALSVGALAPWVGNALYLSGLDPLPSLDLTPFGFAVSVLVLAPGIVRLRIFDLLPVARAAVIESMTTGVVVLDADNRVVDINAAAASLIGVTPPATLGRAASELFAGRPDLVQRYSGVAEAEDEIEIGPAGQRRQLALRITPLYDSRSNRAGRLVLLTDISEWRRSELERERSIQRFRQIFEEAPIGIVLVGPDLRFMQVNQAICDMLGYTREELVGRTFMEITHPDDRAPDETRATLLFAGQLAGYKVEKRYLTRSGETVWIELSTGLISGEGEGSRYALSMIQNVSARKQAEDEIRHLNESLERRVAERTAELAAANRELEIEIGERKRVEAERADLLTREQAARQRSDQAVRQREELLSVVSHDLKNPLTSITGFTSNLLRRAARDEQLPTELVVERLQRIEGAAKKMALMLNSLLDFARLQTGQQLELFLRPTDLIEMARQVVADIQQNDEQHQIHIETDLPQLTGTWDAFRIERSIANLVTNAIKFSPRGGPVTIKISREAGAPPQGDCAVLSVQDCGIGIPSSDVPHVFERFHRAGNVTGRIGGTGIGLASARQIIEQHGGSITVNSEEGAGSTFTIKLPLRPPPRQERGLGDDSDDE